MLAPLDVVLSDLWLFDASADRAEASNLVSLDEARARNLLERLQAKLADARQHAPSLVPGVGAGGMHTLQTIGYADAPEEDREED
jgi:hypothetical protein